MPRRRRRRRRARRRTGRAGGRAARRGRARPPPPARARAAAPRRHARELGRANSPGGGGARVDAATETPRASRRRRARAAARAPPAPARGGRGRVCCVGGASSAVTQGAAPRAATQGASVPVRSSMRPPAASPQHAARRAVRLEGARASSPPRRARRVGVRSRRESGVGFGQATYPAADAARGGSVCARRRRRSGRTGAAPFAFADLVARARRSPRALAGGARRWRGARRF